jgi:hypothetical protein
MTACNLLSIVTSEQPACLLHLVAFLAYDVACLLELLWLAMLCAAGCAAADCCWSQHQCLSAERPPMASSGEQFTHEQFTHAMKICNIT